MTPMCFGLIMDHPIKRPYYEDRVSLRSRRNLVLMTTLLIRSQATRHRQPWRVADRHLRAA